MDYPNFELKGKIAVITGGTRGLGYGMALALAHAGADVVVASRNEEMCRSVSCELRSMGVRSLGIPCDVTKNDQIRNLIDTVVSELGGIDIMVANAGIACTYPALNLPENGWDDILDVNLRGVFFCDQYAARAMMEQGRGGRIINIASAGGIVGAKGVASYCASKGGVVNLTRALALEWGRYGITVNAVCPGYVPTDINKEQLADPRIRKAIENMSAFRRLGKLEEVAGPVLFLASDAASYITGHALVVDGGTTAN